MILEAFKEIENIDQFEENIIGFNNLKFDLPFMLKRLEILGHMKPEFRIMIHNKKDLTSISFSGTDFSQRIGELPSTEDFPEPAESKHTCM